MIRLAASAVFLLLFGGSTFAGGLDESRKAPPSAAAVMSGSDAVIAAPIVMAAQIGEYRERTRFVVEVSDPLKLRVFTLANPDRVVIDMPEVLWRLSSADRPTGRGVVESYRYGLFRPGNSRFVIDLSRPASTGEPMILPPVGGKGYRLVLDLFPTTQAKFEHSAGWPADLRAKETAAEHLAELPAPGASDVRKFPAAQKRLIVVDAGHGGIDAGTTGIDGLLEKDLVLDEALRLRKLLEKRGYAVRLTRDSDVYIPLQERVNIARGDQADLFVSLHADSNPDPGVYGASVYTLSAAGSDREAADLARKENQSDVIAGVDLSGQNSPVASILIGLAQRDTLSRSARFAQFAVGGLSHVTDILPREPHRSAGFVVLKAPDVPAVLIELGYLSNRHDCAQMGIEAWRDKVASAIAGAIDRHFRDGGPEPESAESATAQAAE